MVIQFLAHGARSLKRNRRFGDYFVREKHDEIEKFESALSDPGLKSPFHVSHGKSEAIVEILKVSG